jgi:hypothetical protein
MTFSMPRPLARITAVAGAVVLTAAALAGCSSEPTASATPTCEGHVKVVLLGDDSATTVVAFDPADSPKQFNIPATPAPTCAYRSESRRQGTEPATVTHRTYLYIGITSDAAQKLIAGLNATAGQAPWTGSYANVPAPSTTPAPYTLQTASWDFNASAAPDQERGSMSYAYNAPINPGVAEQAGLEGTPNVLRIETELTSPSK